jgi:hypothetical protein
VQPAEVTPTFQVASALAAASASKMAPVGHVGMDHRCKPSTFTLILLCFAAVVKLCVSEADDISVSTGSSESFSQSSSSSDALKDKSLFFDQLYAEGVKAYNDQLWYKCAYNLEKAVQEYKSFMKTLTDCRLKCKRGEGETYLDKIPIELGEFELFANFLKHADCFRRCKSDAYYRRPGLRLTKQVEHTFKSRKPYTYLQFCWYKVSFFFIFICLFNWFKDRKTYLSSGFCATVY